MRLPSALLAWIALFPGLALLSSCREGPSPVEIPSPEFTIWPEPYCDQGVIGDILNPCVIEISGIVVRAVHRRLPWDPIQWPDPIRCDSLPGGCFPEDQDEVPILGPRIHYNYSGPYMEKMTAPGWGTNRFSAWGTWYGSAMDMAIRDIAHHDVEDVCIPIQTALTAKLRAGEIYMGYDNYSRLGEWVEEEEGEGSIYININTGTGYIWTSPYDYDHDLLRQTLIEEGIHMWFGKDIGHSPSYTQEQREAFIRMRQDCGFYR